jgi:hypothetical protein
MIARVLGAGITIAVYFAAATLTAQVILGGYLWIAWKMDRDRVVQMLAIAQGIDLFAAARSHGQDEDGPGPEQPSLEQLIAARTVKDLDLTLREQALQNGVGQLASEERQLADRQETFKQMTSAYEAQLRELMEAERVAGRDSTRAILENLKPSQAKQQISLMLEKDEIDEVVLLLAEMSDRPLSKILAEFDKLPEDQEKLGEILRMIREGRPAATLAERTANELAGTGQNAQEEGNK